MKIILILILIAYNNNSHNANKFYYVKVNGYTYTASWVKSRVGKFAYDMSECMCVRTCVGRC